MDLLVLACFLGSSVSAILEPHGDDHHERLKRSNVETVSGEGEKTMLDRMQVTIEEKGIPNTVDYRIFFKAKQGYISPMHDIPLYSNYFTKVCNMIVEIPRWTNAKMEISLREFLNPIKHDMKAGLPRYVPNLFPHHGYMWNYGALPETWENPAQMDPHMGHKGDGDPVDVLEIGERIAKRGEIIQVKILGILGLIDEGESDWKVIAINVHDPNADKLNDIGDVDTLFPGYLKATREWLENYKIVDGKMRNTLAFDGVARNRDFALLVIEENHQQWIQLMLGKVKAVGVSVKNTMVGTGNLWPFQMAERVIDEREYKNGSAPPIDRAVEKSHYILHTPK